MSNPHFECRNSRCPNYAGNGVQLSRNHIRIDHSDKSIRCVACGQHVQVARPDTDTTAKVVAGATGGGLLGWALGGPAGLFAGLLIGLVLTNAANGEER